MIYQVLSQLGLNEKESRIYIALLEMGDQPVSVIAKKASLNRTTSYDILNSLTKKGIVSSFIKRNTKYFSAIDPKSLFTYLDNLEKQIQAKREVLKENLHELEHVKIKTNAVPKVRFFEGLDGVKQVYIDSLDSDTIHAFANIINYPPELDDFMYHEYTPKRLEKNISLKGLAPDTKENRRVEKAKGDFLREVRFLPLDLAVQIEINIYNNKVAFMSFIDKSYIGIIIENPEIYEAMTSIYQICWLFANKD